MSDAITVGVSVAIPQPHAKILSSWRARVGDPAAGLVLPHVTLLPPTKVRKAALADVEEHLAKAAVTAEPFAMHLAGTGTFRPTSPVVYIQVSAGVSQCELLESAIRSGFLDRDLEFPYHPHVTIAQDLDEAALDEAYEGLSDFVARFAVDRFALYSRGSDGGWTWCKDFPLGTAPAG